MTDALDRREFHAKLTKGAALLGLAGASTEVVRADEPTPDDKPADEPKPMSPAQLIVELTKQQYPHENLSEEFLTALQSHVNLNLSYAETLDNFGLTNADPPGPMMYFPPRES